MEQKNIFNHSVELVGALRNQDYDLWRPHDSYQIWGFVRKPTFFSKNSTLNLTFTTYSPNGTFKSLYVIWKKNWTTWLHLKWYESAIDWLYPKYVSGYVQLRPSPYLRGLTGLSQLNLSQDFKNYFCWGFLAMLEGKIRVTPFLKVQFSKIPVCRISGEMFIYHHADHFSEIAI